MSRTRFYQWLSYHLPRELVYFCCIRMAAYATTGKYQDQIVPELTWDQMCRRWDEKE